MVDLLYKTPKNKNAPSFELEALNFRDPVGTRTLDPLIKSQLLYQLSYRVINYNSL